MIDEVEVDLEPAVTVRDRRRRQAPRRHVQRDVPPVVERRREGQPHLADDLGPHVQRGDRGLPVPPRQLRPRTVGGRRGPGIRSSDEPPRDRRVPPSCRQPASGCDTSFDQLGDPLPEAIEVLGVVVAAGLADPPGRLVGRFAQRRTTPRPSGVRPALAWTQATSQGWPAMAARNAALSASMSTSWPSYVPGADPLELDLRLGEPRAEVGDDVADGPVRVAVVAGLEALLGRQRPDERRRSRTSPAARPRSRRHRDARAAASRSAVGSGRRSWRARELAFERQAGVLPVEQAARVAPDVAVAAPDEVAVQRDARQAVDVRAVDDDLVVRAGPPRRARRACRSGSSPGCAWRRTPSG